MRARKKKGLFILYGQIGSGKSTEAALGLPNAFVIKSGENVLQFYHQLKSRRNEFTLAAGLPVREVTLETYTVTDENRLAPDYDPDAEPVKQYLFGANGEVIPYPPRDTLMAWCAHVATACEHNRAHNQPLVYKNLIIDEAGALAMRVHELDFVPYSFDKKGEPDTRGAYLQTSIWARQWGELLRRIVSAGCNVALLAHPTEPDLAAGRQGGPKIVSKATSAVLCGEADGVIMRTIEDVVQSDVTAPRQPPKRRWLVHASQNYSSKLRGVSDEDYNELRDMNFAQILDFAGYAAV